MQLFRALRAASPFAAAAHLPAKNSYQFVDIAEIIRDATFLHQLSTLPAEVVQSSSTPATSTFSALSRLPPHTSCPIAAALPRLSSIVAALEATGACIPPSRLPRPSTPTPATTPRASAHAAAQLLPPKKVRSEVDRSASRPPAQLPRRSLPPPTKPPATAIRPAAKVPTRALLASKPLPASRALDSRVIPAGQGALPVGKRAQDHTTKPPIVEMKIRTLAKVQTAREQQASMLMLAANAALKAKKEEEKKEKKMKENADMKAREERRAAYRAKMEKK